MEKISTIKIKLSEDSVNKLSYRQGSLMHGVLIELLDQEYANFLHQNELHPYSQYIEKIDNDEIYWNITSLNSEAGKQLISKILQIDSIFIKKLNANIKFVDKQYREESYQRLTNDFYNSSIYSNFIDISLLSPMSFKQDGNYALFPNVRSIFKSLMKKYDSAMNDTNSCIYDETVLDELANRSKINRYNLKSCGYPIEGITIPSFWGRFTIKINGPQTMINLANMLLRYGEYSGVGIKTALGMGAIRVTSEKKGVKDEFDD